MSTPKSSFKRDLMNGILKSHAKAQSRFVISKSRRKERKEYKYTSVV